VESCAGRTLVKMQQHILASMRGHLASLDLIPGALAAGHESRAAHLAGYRLGMSSLPRHHAAQMVPYMPAGMWAAGRRLHRAASRFAMMVVEGGRMRTYAALRKVTDACIAFHSAYRIR